MIRAPKPANERQRLEALHSYDILDTTHEEAFDVLAKLAASLCDTPIGLVSLVDSERQWFKASCGLTVPSTSRDISFCAHAIVRRSIYEVTDAAIDPRFLDNPLVTGEPFIRFYAGVPLIDTDGMALGNAMCSRPETKTTDSGTARTSRALGNCRDGSDPYASASLFAANVIAGPAPRCSPFVTLRRRSRVRPSETESTLTQRD